MQRGTVLVVCWLVALWAPGSAQNLATPVTKVTQMLEDMKGKSEKLKKEADAIYAKAKSSCASTVSTKKEEIKGLNLEISKLGAEVLQLGTDIKELVAKLNDDKMGHELDASLLDGSRKTRLQEQNTYQRDLSEYTVAISAVQRAIAIMGKHSASFLQTSDHEVQAALKEVASAIYTPDGGGLAKDDKIFDEFDSLTTNSGAYKSVAGKGKGVTGVLDGLKKTFMKAKNTIMADEQKAKLIYAKTEKNLLQQLDTSREAVSTNKGTKAQKEEALTTKKGELEQSKINLDSTSKFLKEAEKVCAQKKTSYEEMSKLRNQEIVSLTKAVDIIKGTVAANSANLNSKAGGAFAQINANGQPQFDRTQHLVKSLDAFIDSEAGKLNSRQLVLLANKVKVLAVQAPADALAKVKTMISDLIVKMQKDGAAEATQKAFCDDALKKNKKESTVAEASILTNTANVNKVEADLKMLNQEVAVLTVNVKKSEKEKKELIATRTAEKKENAKTVKEGKESIKAVQAAITVLTDYYKEAAKSGKFVQLRADPEGPLADEGGNVIAMLEVVRDGYKTLIVKTEASEGVAQKLYQEQMTDTKVMLAASESEVTNKKSLIADNTKLLPMKKKDLSASKTALSDAGTTLENLKAPCLNGNAAEQRKQQVEAELAALKEALEMLEAYQGAFLQEVTEQDAEQVPANTKQIIKIATLLNGIKKDVQKDLDGDTAAFKDMQKWCVATKTETAAAIKVQRDRDEELITAIEISTQQKTILTTQLVALKSEVAKNKESMGQMGSMRGNDMKSFQKSEKDTVVAIASLRSAIGVLKTKYAQFDKDDKRDFNAEQAAIKKGSLVKVADDVAKALKFLPTSEFNLAVTGETGAILQGFLSRPDELLGGSRHAGLTQTGSQVNGSPVSGKTILGILENLMDTFTADLAAMQGKEKLGISTYLSTKTAKQSQISAMEASTTTKESQLAHYTTMNAQAKEDLAYLRQTNKFDMQYLEQVTDQCSTSEHEFLIRKKTREDEIAALSEGISILTAGAGVVNAAPKKALVHHSKRLSRVFVHHHDTPKKRAVLKIGPPKASTPVAPKKSMLAAVKAKAVPSFLQVSKPLHHSLSALAAQVKSASQRLAAGPMTNNAIKSVVMQIDVVVVQLKTQKKMEIKKQDSCVKENNAALEQRQRRITDKARLENTIVTLKTNVKSAMDEMGEIKKQKFELDNNMKEAAKTRKEAHAAYGASVKEQLHQQKVLNQAIAALKNFYAEKKKEEKAAFLEVKPTTMKWLFKDLEHQLQVAGQQVTEGHTATVADKQTAQYDAWARDPNIKTICETGFNAGHSALRFLAQSNATLFEFDLGVHPYGKVGAQFLMNKFPGRLHTLWGDSTVVMPLFRWQRSDVHCDLMVVDGGHQYDVAKSDLKNFAKMASKSHIVAIDDSPCTDELCVGPTRAWQELIQQGCIAQTQSVTMSASRGYSVGHFIPCKALDTLATQTTKTAAVSTPVAAPVKLFAAHHAAQKVSKASAEPKKAVIPQTKEQKALDDGIKKNMNMKKVDVKNVKAKRVEKPKGFNKPMKAHSGGKGVIGILEIVLEESEALIKQDVKDETNEVNLHLAGLEKTKQVIAQKDKENVMLTQVKSDNELQQTQAEQQLKVVETEKKQIEDFLVIVYKNCGTFLQQFASNQAARAQEIQDTMTAKEVLAGMTEFIQAPKAALMQLTRSIQHAQGGVL